jgi:hypothetical protein
VLRPAGTADAPTAVIVDYLAAPRWVAPLLVAAGGVARRQGAVAMSVKTRNEPADRHLRTAGFVRRQRGTDEPVRFMVRCNDPVVAPLVNEPANWFVTSADSDLEYAMTPGAGGDVASSVTTSPDPATLDPATLDPAPAPAPAPADSAPPHRTPADRTPAEQSETP